MSYQTRVVFPRDRDACSATGLNGAVYGHGVSFNSEEGQSSKGGHGGDYLGDCRKE